MWGNDRGTVEVLEEMQRNSAAETSTTDTTVAGDRDSSNHVQQVSSGRQIILLSTFTFSESSSCTTVVSCLRPVVR